MTLDVSSAAKDCIAERGYDVRYGARPLKRTLVKEVLNPLSRLILEGSVHEGDVVRVRTRGEALNLQKKESQSTNDHDDTTITGGTTVWGWGSGSNPISQDKNDSLNFQQKGAFNE